MKYIFQNIKILAKNEKFIFAVMLVCIFVSSWIMTFSYGLYQNYHSMRIEGETDSKEISPEIAAGETLTQGELKLYLDSLSDTVLSGMNVIFCSTSFDFVHVDPYSSESYTRDVMVSSRFVVSGGEYRASPYIADIWNSNGMIKTGRYFMDADETEGLHSAMVQDAWINDPVQSLDYAELLDGTDTITLFGEKYSIIGTHRSNGVAVPFLSLPNDAVMNSFTLSFENAISRKSYDELKRRAGEILPGKLIFPELPFPDEESVYIYNNIMLISALIAALSVINFALLYDFIFKKRRRQLAIMRICGCTPLRAWGICLGECCVVCVPVFLLGMATFIPFMHSFLSDIFIYMENSYSPAIYAAIFIIYMVMLLVIMGMKLLIQINRALSEAQKKGVG